MAATLGPMNTVIVSKVIKTLKVAEGLPMGPEQAQIHERESNRPPSDIFKTGTELMYGGQGKNTNNFNLTPVSAKRNDEISAINVADVVNTNEGLDQPRLDETTAEVTGEEKRKLRIQETQATTQGCTSITKPMDNAHGTGRLRLNTSA
jgi:hypothetical protein